MLFVFQHPTSVLKVSTLNFFKTILDDQKSLPKDQAYNDLIKLVNFILHKFFKALEEEPFLAVEVRFSFLLSYMLTLMMFIFPRTLQQAFFPKNRGHWKQYSSWEPETKGRHEHDPGENSKFSPEVQVKKGYTWSEQIGIAIAALVEEGKTELVEWVKDVRNHIKSDNVFTEPLINPKIIDPGASDSSAQ